MPQTEPKIDTWELIRQAGDLISGVHGELCQGGDYYGCRASDALRTALDRLFMLRDEEGIRLVWAALEQTDEAIAIRSRMDRDRAAEEARLEAEAQTVECPYCGAQPDTWCRTVSVRRTRTRHHRDRLRAARGLLAADTTNEGDA